MTHENEVVYIKYYSEASNYALVSKSKDSNKGQYKVPVEELVAIEKK